MMAMVFVMTRTSSYYTPSQQIICDRVLWPEYIMSDNVRQLFLPAGIYYIFNPYQESNGVITKLTGAIQRPTILMLHILVYGPYTMPCRKSLWAVLYVLQYSGLVRDSNTMPYLWAHLVVMKIPGTNPNGEECNGEGRCASWLDTSHAFWWQWLVITLVVLLLSQQKQQPK